MKCKLGTNANRETVAAQPNLKFSRGNDFNGMPRCRDEGARNTKPEPPDPAVRRPPPPPPGGGWPRMAQRVVDDLDAVTCEALGKHWAQENRHAQRIQTKLPNRENMQVNRKNRHTDRKKIGKQEKNKQSERKKLALGSKRIGNQKNRQYLQEK